MSLLKVRRLLYIRRDARGHNHALLKHAAACCPKSYSSSPSLHIPGISLPAQRCANRFHCPKIHKTGFCYEVLVVLTVSRNLKNGTVSRNLNFRIWVPKKRSCCTNYILLSMLKVPEACNINSSGWKYSSAETVTYLTAQREESRDLTGAVTLKSRPFVQY